MLRSTFVTPSNDVYTKIPVFSAFFALTSHVNVHINVYTQSRLVENVTERIKGAFDESIRYFVAEEINNRVGDTKNA